MDIKIIVALTGIIAGIISALATYFATRKETKVNAEDGFRDDILQRINSMESKIQHLENEVNRWKSHYWSLYAWLTAFVIRNGIEEIPPQFHKEGEETA